ncbi:immunoglobulin-like domain-containing protein [Jeotgalibaca sp. A122]|uniref:immunoglobulin-like domain-containing protein n=1 Tax=Jeotgalibaca sp. A122 TaxID=3457322 RepID=UPI003FCFF240
MKKRSGWFITSILTTLLLAGCKQTAFEPSPYKPADLNHLSGVTMQTAEPSYPTDIESIAVTITNKSEAELFYGVAFSVEYLDGNEWVIFPFEDEMAWIEIALILEPDATNTEELNMTLLKHDFEPGSYRIIKDIAGETLTAEFEIEME